jgi:O-antigen/teichoic acid export membrane protein
MAIEVASYFWMQPTGTESIRSKQILSGSPIKESETKEHSAHKPSLAASYVSSYGPLVVQIVTSLLLIPFLVGRLGATDFGIWMLAGSFLGYYGLLRLGVGAGLMRYVPYYTGQGDNKSASEIVSTSTAIFVLVGFVILAISLLAADAIARFYEAGPQLAALVRIMGIAAAIECPMRILGGTIRAHERWVEANIVTVVSVFTRAVSVAGCVYLGYGLVQMAYAVLGVTIVTLVLTTIMFVKFCPLIRLRVSLVKRSQLRRLVSFGALTVVVTMAYTMALDGHKLIIGKLVSVAAVGFYAFAAMMMKHARAAVVTPSRVFWPRFALLDGQQNHKEISRLLFRGTQYSTMLASGIMLLAIVGGPSFIRLWVGGGIDPEDMVLFETVFPTLIILSVAYLIDTSLAINASLLGGVGRQGAQAVFASVEGVLGFGLSILFGRRMGLPGVALGFTISVVLIRGLVRTLYICHFLEISVFRFFNGCLLRPWLILGLLASVAYLTGVVEYADNWPCLIIFVITFGCLYTLCAYGIAMSNDDREHVHSYIRKISLRTLSLLGVNK